MNKVKIMFCFFSLVLFLMVRGVSAQSNFVVNQTISCTAGNSYFSTIQSAINAANSGDTITVCQGNYNENINITKPLNLLSYSGPSVTIINASNPIFYTIFVNATNFVNISRFTVEGSYTGIYFLNSNNSIASNNIITKNRMGTILALSSNDLLTNNAINSNSNYGIEVDSPYNTITNNIINSNNEYGISVDRTSNNLVNNNTISGNGYGGIILLFASNNTISNNLAGSTYNGYGIYLYTSSGNTINGNTANSDSADGISLTSSSYNIVNNNTANSNSGDGIDLDYLGTGGVYSLNNIVTNNIANSNDVGIYVSSSSNNTIINNNIANSNSANGILIYSSSNITINNNIETGSTYAGIELADSPGNTVNNNTASFNGNNAVGIQLYYDEWKGSLGYPSYNNITNNVVNSNGYGIWVTYSSYDIIKNNVVNSNGYGISFDSYSNSSIITGNTVKSNGMGILFDNTTPYSNYNLVYNNFLQNTINAQDSGTNYWNTTKTLGTNIAGGPYIGGNYWSDYTGKDTDDDRIGNTNLPYNSNGNIAIGGDYLPLVVPGITIFSPINNTEYYKVNVLLNFTVNIPTSWIAYSLNGKPNITIPGPVNITAPANMTGSTTLVNGLNNLKVYARNSYGNTISSSVSFNYCKSDTTGDKKVNVLDLIKVASKLNTKCGDANYDPAVDLNDDCAINVLDLILVSSNLNAVC